MVVRGGNEWKSETMLCHAMQLFNVGKFHYQVMQIKEKCTTQYLFDIRQHFEELFCKRTLPVDLCVEVILILEQTEMY